MTVPEKVEKIAFVFAWAKRRPRYRNIRWNVCNDDSVERFFSVKRRVKVKWA